MASGLTGTLVDLEVAEKDAVRKTQQLRDVLEQQRLEQEEEFIKENGIKVVDYETGQIAKVAGLSNTQIKKKLEEIDPAVLHYNYDLLGQIAILLGASAIGGICAAYINIPPHIGYLFGGVFVGPSCLGVVRNFKEVETISLFGSIFLLFGHGAGYDAKSTKLLKKYLAGGAVYIVATVLLVACATSLLGWTGSVLQGIIVGVAACFTITAPLYERLRADKLIDTSYGRTITSIIALQDALMSFALGTPEWFSVQSSSQISKAAVWSIFSYASVIAVTHGLHIHIVPPLMHFLGDIEQLHQSPLVLLGVVSVCLFMALLTEAMGLSLECGAFFAGLAFMDHTNRSVFMEKAITSIRVIENLFGSMFFACVGMILNPLFLLRNFGQILSMVLMILCIKTICTTAVMTYYKVSFRKAYSAGIGLCQVGELALIFMIKAHSSHLVSRRVYLLMIASISVFLGCSSIFNRRAVLARKKKLDSTLRKDQVSNE